MLRVGIIGVSGYTGVELARILCRHPEIEITLATSRQFEGKPLAEIFPNLRDCIDITCESPDIDTMADRADFFFTAVPHKTAMDIVPLILEKGKKVVDLSADFRIRDVAVYEEWYQKHTSSELIKSAVYGLPEFYRSDIAKAQLVANPGCYPTSVALGLAPLIREGLIDLSTIIVDSKSGTSGAGRSASLVTLFCEVADGFKAYKVGGAHRHIPEMEQELSVLAGQQINISFTPHLLPISRGILSTIYAKLTKDITLSDVYSLYNQTYTEEQFVRLCQEGVSPTTQHVRGSNFCDIGIAVDKRTNRIIVISAIDNIVKGAAGQAVQNMNLMNGFAENTGLLGAPFFP